MPIVDTDLVLRLSGGAGNSDPNASLGGAKSSTVVPAGVHNLFDQVSGAETTAGDTEYRCVYWHNAHATLTLQSAKVWVVSNTPSGDTEARIALGTSGVNGTEQTVGNESTAPTGVTWSTAANEGAALAIGNIPAGQHMAVWIERTVNAGAGSYSNDPITVRVKGETAA